MTDPRSNLFLNEQIALTKTLRVRQNLRRCFPKQKLTRPQWHLSWSCWCWKRFLIASNIDPALSAWNSSCCHWCRYCCCCCCCCRYCCCCCRCCCCCFQIPTFGSINFFLNVLKKSAFGNFSSQMQTFENNFPNISSLLLMRRWLFLNGIIYGF